MKKTVVVLAFVLMATVAFGQSANFGFQGTLANVNVPKPLSEIYGFGYGGGVHLDVNLPVLLSFRLQGDYVRFSPDQGKYQALLASLVGGTAAQDFSIDGGAISVWSANANVKSTFLPLPIISPYVTGGIGMANLSASDATVKYRGQAVQGGTIPGAKGETKFSANVGAGADLKLGITLYIEARYTWIFTEGETSTYIPISIGVTL